MIPIFLPLEDKLKKFLDDVTLVDNSTKFLCPEPSKLYLVHEHNLPTECGVLSTDVDQ